MSKKVISIRDQSAMTKKNDQVSSRLKLRIDDLKTFDPLTANQQKFFNFYNKGCDFFTLHGLAGTGKSFIALYKAIEEVLDKSNPYKSVIVVRSSVQSRDMGHLPGDVDSKMDVYKQPYKQICETLFGRKDAWDRLNEQKHIEFVSTSFIRGMTFNDSIIVVDECQNMNWGEISTIMTRIGYRSKIIWCGDYRQNDLTRSKNDVSGIKKFLEVASKMPSHIKIEFGVDDIVRSDLVKEWIIAEMKYDDHQSSKDSVSFSRL